MQWADPATWRLAQYLLTMGDPEQPWPLCLVLAHRPLDGSTQAEVTMLHRHPATERVILGPLDADASNELCRRLLNVSYVEPHLAQHVIRHTEGQPLFIREYLRVLAQHSLIEITDGSAHLREGSPSVQAAYSAQGVIQARVDRLDEPTRLTLKIAAVIGRSFPLHLLAAIHPTQPDEATLRRQLDQLHLQQIIDLELGDPEPVYRFKHGITHEVAYNSLLFGQRRQLHAQIARWYAQTHAAALRSHLAPLAVYDVLIAHLRRAEEWDATVHACHEATLCALRQNSTGAALRSIEQALVLTTNADIRSTLLLLRLSIHERIGSLGSQGDTLREALDLTAHIAHPLLHTYAQVLHVVYLLTIGEPISAIRQVRYLYRQLHGRNLPPDQVRLLQICLIDLRGAARLQHGVPAHAARLHRIALRKAQELLANPPPPLVPGLFALPALILRCLNNLGDALLALEQLKSALECHRQALKLAQTHSDWYAEARARQGLSAVYLAYGADNEAHTQAMRGLTTSHAIADRAGQTLALRQLAAISANRGDYAEAQRQAWHALAISTSTQARALERELLHAIAAYATAQGQYEEAAAARQEALREQ
jgi:tetratricopeptide (TPR) repeat protein